MIRKMIATFTAVTAALLVVGVAWASGDDDTSTSVTSAGSSTSTSGDTATSVTSATSASTPTTSGATTSSSDATEGNSPPTSLASNSTTSTSLGATTSTSSGSTTSTSSGSSTSTSLGGNDQAPPDGQSTYSIPGLGNVTIAVRSGSLALVNVTAPGWNVEIDKEEADRIEIEFERDDAEAKFEARIRGSQIDVKTEVDSD